MGAAKGEQNKEVKEMSYETDMKKYQQIEDMVRAVWDGVYIPIYGYQKILDIVNDKNEN